MTYTDLYCSSGNQMFVQAEHSSHWDIAISCYEPLDAVTGGIGTYTRLLIGMLSDSPALKDKTIALFCRKAPTGAGSIKAVNLTIFEVPQDKKIVGKKVTQMGDDHDWYSWNLAHYLLRLSQHGHSFGLFEFSDYGIEAYFTLKMRRAGLLKIETLALRLHSPELMLFRDNLLPARTYDSKRLTRISRELFCYQHSDRILYGAPAMLERIAVECRRFGIEIKSKAEHVEHPYPIHEDISARTQLLKRTSINLGYIGRLEVRKGILKFLSEIAESQVLCQIVSDLDIVFELFGADCVDQNNVSIKSQVLALHKVPQLRGRIIVHGYMTQVKLREKTIEMDGFIFPSIFENYPNALLEVLHTDAPILVSDAGGMQYISRDLPGIFHFGYGSNFSKGVEEFFCSLRRVPNRWQMYRDMANTINNSIVARYGHLGTLLSSAPTRPSPIKDATGIDFVMAFYNDAPHVAPALKSVKAVMTDRDRLIIVDDASQVDQYGALEKQVWEIFGEDNRVSLHRMPVNSGPSAARNVGTKIGSNPLIQFLDSDDYLDVGGFQVTKQYLQSNNDVDFVYGVQNNFGGKSHVWVPRDSSAMTCLDENYTHSAILIRRSAFDGSGGFDDEMRLHFEDWQFNCKLVLSGYRGEVVPFITLFCSVRNGSRTFRNNEREVFSREQVIDRSCISRGPQQTLLQGELLELLGKYSSLVNGRHQSVCHAGALDGSVVPNMTLEDLCSLEGVRFVRAAYEVVLGRSADEAGLRFYLDQMKRGIGKRAIIADMLASTEMRNKRRILPKEYYTALRVERFVRNFPLRRYLFRSSAKLGSRDSE